jgi:hypothetical protein
MKFIQALLVLFAASNAFAADPQIASWFTLHSDKFAQIYPDNAAKNSGQTSTTWSNGRNTQAQPAYCGVQQILSSSNWVYIRSTGLGSQIMGPWQNGRFPNLPTDQHYIFAIPRHPTAQTGNRFNRLGEIGMFVDGVRMFDSGDAWSYSRTAGRDFGPGGGGGNGDRIWNRDAYLNESRTFDSAFAHQQQWGTYHYHAEPIALRYLLGDHVDFDAATKTYHESKSTPVKHSPIIGWIQDGYPLYGPYGYSNPTNPASGIRRMETGFAARTGGNGTDNLVQTGRTTLPAWAVREQHIAANQPGPAVSQTRPVGYYIEDYAYLGDCGKIPGKDFDLDELNGRWCVTPEFPNGTYAYFTTIDAEGTPVYPYNMGRRYHGNPVGQLCNRIGEPVVTNFNARAETVVKTASSGTTKTTTLTWKADGYESKAK